MVRFEELLFDKDRAESCLDKLEFLSFFLPDAFNTLFVVNGYFYVISSSVVADILSRRLEGVTIPVTT